MIAILLILFIILLFHHPSVRRASNLAIQRLRQGAVPCRLRSKKNTPRCCQASSVIRRRSSAHHGRGPRLSVARIAERFASGPRSDSQELARNSKARRGRSFERQSRAAGGLATHTANWREQKMAPAEAGAPCLTDLADDCCGQLTQLTRR
jgi:hypothetical protein